MSRARRVTPARKLGSTSFSRSPSKSRRSPPCWRAPKPCQPPNSPEPLFLRSAHCGLEEEMRLRISALRLAAWVLLSASHASAQTVVTRGWDVSVMTGVFVGRPQRFDTIDRNFDNWYNSGTFAISAARYLTPHLKAEGEVMWSAEGERFVQRYVQVPGVPGIPPYPVGANQMVKTNGVSAGLAY